MRPIAIEEDWLHLESTEAGPKIAAIFFLVESGRMLGVPIRQYLADGLPGLAGRSIQQLVAAPTACGKSLKCGRTFRRGLKRLRKEAWLRAKSAPMHSLRG